MGILIEKIPTLAQIATAIAAERKFQDKKYGPVLEGSTYSNQFMQQGPGGHELPAWLLIIEKELDEAKDAAVHGGKHATGRNTTRQEILQIAAVCFAALEQHGLEES